MKRLFSLILTVCMLMGALVYTAAPAGAVTHGFLLGDADDNGIVDMKDVILIRRYLTSLEKPKDISLTAADVDQNGSVDMSDVLELRKSFVALSELGGNNTDKAYKVDSISIGGKNISRFTIVIPDASDVAMNYAAVRLKNYISSACGITLNITDDENDVEGYMIKYQYDTDNLYELGLEGYRVAVEEDGNLTFTCGSMRGPLYVTFFFLEEVVGWRFLTDPDDWVITYLYEAENIDLPVGYAETEVPLFTYRAVSQKGITNENFKMLRVNGVDGGAPASAEYGWGVGTLFIHAHSYMYQCKDMGIDENNQPCLTSDETYEHIINYNVNLIDERQAIGQLLGETWTQISCSPNDNTKFCTCNACKAVYAAEGSISGTVFRMSNRVAEELAKRYPGIEIYTIAYWDARKPPKMTRPLDNVSVCYCIGGCNNHTYDRPEDCVEAGGNPRLPTTTWDGGSDGNSSNALDLMYYEQWMELTNNVTIWYYSPNYHFYMSPAANLFNVYNDFKYVAASGATGVYSEGCYGDHAPTNSYEMLRGYMISKMLWDPFMSEEEYNDLFNEFLMIYYGDGWEYMRKAIEMEDYASDLNGCWTNNFDRPWNVYNEEYIAEHYLEIRELYDKAYEAATTTEQQRRVIRCRAHIDFLGLSATFESDYENGSSETKAAYVERYKELYNLVLDRGDIPGAKGDVIYLFSGGTGTAGCNNFPKSADDIYSPMEWILTDFTGYWELIGDRWV